MFVGKPMRRRDGWRRKKNVNDVAGLVCRDWVPAFLRRGCSYWHGSRERKVDDGKYKKGPSEYLELHL